MCAPSHLKTGYEAFRRQRYAIEAERYRELGEGQSPRTMIIGCADSRVDPATIFAAKPGELFVVRNVAAIVPPHEEDDAHHGTSAAVEFAVTGLKVDTIVVMGHGQCGGIAASLAAAEQRPIGRFIAPWVRLLDEVRDELLSRGDTTSLAERQRALELMSVRRSLENLLTFPFVAEAAANGKLALHGAWFSIAEGQLHWLDGDRRTFSPLTV
ncbi:MAG: carbonic anhydrase [Hyphomicrobiaceae bacterium]|nr:carbonic anhydrase [Hyphomicrobiaceae bacterium]